MRGKNESSNLRSTGFGWCWAVNVGADVGSVGHRPCHRGAVLGATSALRVAPTAWRPSGIDTACARRGKSSAKAMADLGFFGAYDSQRGTQFAERLRRIR